MHQSVGRYVKELKSGKFKIDAAKLKQDERLAGKYLLSTSDQHISTEDIALGYKLLLEVERLFQTLKSCLCSCSVNNSEVKTKLTWFWIIRQMSQVNFINF